MLHFPELNCIPLILLPHFQNEGISIRSVILFNADAINAHNTCKLHQFRKSAKVRRICAEFTKMARRINTSSLITTHSAARNLGFIFDEHLTSSDQISALSQSCYYHIRELRCIRPYLDFITASTIATSIVHSKLDYCNSLYYNLP